MPNTITIPKQPYNDCDVSTGLNQNSIKAVIFTSREYSIFLFGPTVDSSRVIFYIGYFPKGYLSPT